MISHNLRSVGLAGLLLTLILALPSGCHSNKSASQNAANSNDSPAGQSAIAPGQTGPDQVANAGDNGSVPNGQRNAGNSGSAMMPSNGNAAANQTPALAPLQIPAGTLLRVRLNNSINVKSAQTGDPFTGTTADPVSLNGRTLIPAGTPVEGIVTAAHRRGRFKGHSVLQLRLTGLDLQNHHYQLDTGHYTRSKHGKGHRSALMIGGGTGLGMLVGGLATGGVGLVVGGLAGAGAGTAGAAFTGNRDIGIPAESVLSFRLDRPVTMRP